MSKQFEYNDNVFAEAMIEHAAEQYRKFDVTTPLNFSKCIYDCDEHIVTLVDNENRKVFCRKYSRVQVQAIMRKKLISCPGTHNNLLDLKNHRINLSKKLGNWN